MHDRKRPIIRTVIGIVLLEEQRSRISSKAIEELSDQLAEQWTVVDQLRNKLDRLTERFLTLGNAQSRCPGQYQATALLIQAAACPPQDRRKGPPFRRALHIRSIYQ